MVQNQAIEDAKTNCLDVLGVLNLDELEQGAESNGTLSQMVYDYYASGADSGSSKQGNRDSFARFKLLPRMLRDVSNLDMRTRVLGCDLAFPVMVAPMAMQRMAHPEGEIAVSRACKKSGNVMILSTMANYSISEVADATGTGHLWFQLYVFRDRKMVKELVQEAEQLGYRALVVTVDAPFLGNREADVRNKFHMPKGMTLGNASRARIRDAGSGEAEGSGIANVFTDSIDDSLTWDLIPFLKSICSLPVIVKGVLHAEDADLAVRHGADGIFVTNHGGRQLDYTVSPMDVLPAVTNVVAGRVPIILDGGVRRGTDILKALALGATAVAVGRPMLYALARGGQDGVEQALGILQKELKLAMALAGCQSLTDISRCLLVHETEIPMRSRL